MIYANSMFFKSVFPVEFWAAVARQAPTVIMCKVSYGIRHIAEDLRSQATGSTSWWGILTCTPPTSRSARRSRLLVDRGRDGPQLIALMDAILRDDKARAREIQDDLDALPPMLPPGIEFSEEFPKYNAQMVKLR